jgi:flagellar biosynthetic protein FliO
MDAGTIVTLVLVLALVFYLSWLTTRLVAGRSRLGAGRFMRVVDRMAVSQNAALLLVKIGGTYCVVSQSAQGVTLVKTLDAEEAEALTTMLGDEKETPDPLQAVQSFGARLAAALKGASWRSQRYVRNERPPQSPAEEYKEAETIDLLDERVRRRKENNKW